MSLNDDRTTEPRQLSARLDQVAAALDSMGLTVVRRAVYEDDQGDGTGALGWLWAQSEPRRFPGETFDVAVTYSAAEGTWSVGTPSGSLYRLSDSDEPGQRIRQLLAEPGNGSTEDATSRTVPEWVWLVLGGVGTTVVAPFVQAVVGKSAEDAYAALRSLLRRKEKPQQDVGMLEHTSILDPDHDVRIIGPDPMPAEAVRQLATMDRAEIDGHVLVWNDDTRTWHRYRRQG
ncbi:hypothetical protein [Actinophytocola sp. NPDC049390]|uniref:hypothetical protein n=1 Tax=Actinophytocola sp. NPDC049390 TaxID=3363894 RepID=UPI0037B9BA03